MKVADLDFSHPEHLVAQAPVWPPRIMAVRGDKPPVELSWPGLLESFAPGDLLVINETKVLRRRVFAGEVEILFLGSADRLSWQVLFPSRKFALGDILELPEGVRARLTEKGRPQRLETDRPLDEAYFERVGELPLPPYIQKARDERHNVAADSRWYQTAWAGKPGSFAAPTASLHFRGEDLEALRARGVAVARLTLHVGLGTFLPVTVEDLDQHLMHEESVEIPAETREELRRVRERGGRVWALGTTVARSLESARGGKLRERADGGLEGATDLLIQPGHVWREVDALLTNFHQPKSTLLALVAAFAGLERVRACYSWAIGREFRLFSYGDLTLWTK